MDHETRHHIHESPKSMTVPLMALAGLSIVGGFVGMPHIFGVGNAFEEWLAPVMANSAHGAEHAVAAHGGDAAAEWGLMAASVVLVLIAIFAATRIYKQKPEIATRLAASFSGLQRLLANKYYIDEIYSVLVVRPLINLSLLLWKVVDVVLIDGFINGAAVVYDDISQLLRTAQTGRVRSYATIFAVGVVVLLALYVYG